MQDSLGIIEAIIPQEEWEKTVRFYTQLYGAPRERNDSEVVFLSVEGDFELRLTNSTQREVDGLKQPRYHISRGHNGAANLQTAYRDVLRGDKTAYSIQAPKRIGPQGKEDTTVAFIGFGDPCGLLESQILCLAHNPKRQAS